MATRFKTGARPSPRHELLKAKPHQVIQAPPPEFAYVPPRLSMWDNDHDGDCVTAEEAFAKACYLPEILISDQEVIAWATPYSEACPAPRSAAASEYVGSASSHLTSVEGP